MSAPPDLADPGLVVGMMSLDELREEALAARIDTVVTAFTDI